MKPLKTHVKESIFDNVEDITNSDAALIEQFLKDNYEIDGTYIIEGSYTIKDNVVDVKGSLEVKNEKIKSLTNGLFRFGKVGGNFDCYRCKNLTSLGGAPEEVGRVFWCAFCPNLKSLEGGPELVGDDFNCFACSSLTSLEGAPKKVGGDFNCYECENLKTLKGAPKTVGGDFNCKKCPKLHSLKGIGVVRGNINKDFRSNAH